MSKIRWSKVVEFVGIAALVASLVFVGLQMRLSHQIAVADIHQQRTALLLSVHHSLIGPDKFADAWIKFQRGEPLTEDEEFMIEMTTPRWLAYWENNHFQYRVGMLSEEQWLSSRSSMRGWFQLPFNRQLWEEIRESGTWHESFSQEIDDVIAEADAGQ